VDHVTHKATGVVVADGLGVAEGFQQRVGLQDDVLDVLLHTRQSYTPEEHRTLRAMLLQHTEHKGS